MDGQSDLNSLAQEFGSCRQYAADCTNPDTSEAAWERKEYLTECDYQNVKDAVTRTQLSVQTIDMQITDLFLGTLGLETEATLLNLYFHADSYQILKVTNMQDRYNQLALTITGFTGDDLYTQTAQTSTRVVDGVDLNTLKVYFANENPVSSQTELSNYQ